MKNLSVMKSIIFILSMMMTLLFWSCQNNNEDDPLSDEQISFNLSENGKNDPELLIGEWEAIAFAYTADGKKITDRTAISNARLIIPSKYKFSDYNGTDLWELNVLNTYWFTCLISDNLINLKVFLVTYVLVAFPHVEHDLGYAFANACSFVINGNELILHFPKIEDKNILFSYTVIKNKNLLIFKKNDKP